MGVGVFVGIGVAVFVGIGVGVFVGIGVSEAVKEGTMVLVDAGAVGSFCAVQDDNKITRRTKTKSEIVRRHDGIITSQGIGKPPALYSLIHASLQTHYIPQFMESSFFKAYYSL